MDEIIKSKVIYAAVSNTLVKLVFNQILES